MISTITTTVAMISALGLGTILGALATVALIGFLAQRELLLTAGGRCRAVARNLNASIAGLLMTFGVIAAARLMAIM